MPLEHILLHIIQSFEFTKPGKGTCKYLTIRLEGRANRLLRLSRRFWRDALLYIVHVLRQRGMRFRDNATFGIRNPKAKRSFLR